MRENKLIWFILLFFICVIFVLLILKTIKLYNKEMYIKEIENEINVIEKELETLENNAYKNK